MFCYPPCCRSASDVSNDALELRIKHVDEVDQSSMEFLTCFTRYQNGSTCLSAAEVVSEIELALSIMVSRTNGTGIPLSCGVSRYRLSGVSNDKGRGALSSS